MTFRYIVVEGNIGSGKTTLATLLSERYGSHLILEEFADNTFLPLFYRDPKRFAFPLELSFLAERCRQLRLHFLQSPGYLFGVVSDYLLEKSFLFAKNNLPRKEYSLYRQFYEIVQADLPAPDLVIYLKRSVENLEYMIRWRGRDFEREIDPEYLRKINETYDRYFEKECRYNKLIIDAEDMDFLNNESDFQNIIGLIEVKMRAFQ